MFNLVNLSPIQALVPMTCLLCEEASKHPVCRGCRCDLPWLGAACERCALPLAKPGMCGQCSQALPTFQRCHSPWRFEVPVGQLINQFKHRRNFRYGGFLSLALADHIRQQYKADQLPDYIVPVPLHWRRLLRRGFNQAHFIARSVSPNIHKPVLPCVKRSLPTSQQQGLNRRERLRNLVDAFAINEKIVKSIPVQQSSVAVVDDVMTTGATAEAISTVLKRAGFEQIHCWVLARTPAPQD